MRETGFDVEPDHRRLAVMVTPRRPWLVVGTSQTSISAGAMLELWSDSADSDTHHDYRPHTLASYPAPGTLLVRTLTSTPQ